MTTPHDVGGGPLFCFPWVCVTLGNTGSTIWFRGHSPFFGHAHLFHVFTSYAYGACTQEQEQEPEPIPQPRQEEVFPLTLPLALALALQGFGQGQGQEEPQGRRRAQGMMCAATLMAPYPFH